MKKIITLFIFLSFINGLSQALNQKEFDMILEEVKNITNNFKTYDDSNFLTQKLNLNEENSNLIRLSVENLGFEFNQLDSRNHLLPFFTESKNDQWLFLNFAAFTSHPTKNGEKFERGTYYFVMYCFAGVQNGKVVFERAKVLSKKDEIHRWFLSLHSVYLKETGKIYDKYGFVPPPPYAPPIDLK